jgi:hypothetical protein
MRLFTIENLELVHRRRDEFRELAEELERVGALTESGPTHLGVLLNLDKDYQSLLDLGMPEDEVGRLFFKLLDARILGAVMRAALTAVGSTDPSELRLEPIDPLADAEILGDVYGGLGGRELFSYARSAEQDVLRPLDSLLPVEVSPSVGLGLPSLHSLRLLSGTRIEISGHELSLRPLVMFDDGHELGAGQRRELLRRLGERTLEVARWYSERFEALPEEELMVGSSLGRDFELLELENAARRGKGMKFERVATDAADRRAQNYLLDYAGVQQRFSELLAVENDELLLGRGDEIAGELTRRVADLVEGHERYSEWVAQVEAPATYDGAVLLRALEIVVRADLERPQRGLFELPLSYEEFESRRPRVMQAAQHFLARDFGLPYYVGPRRLAQLGSENLEQFIRLAGDMFAEMLAEITLRRFPRLTPVQQDRIVRRASERYWRELPQRVRNGRDVQRLVAAIVELAQADTFRPTAPYSPGVTGTALLMTDRERLLSPDVRDAIGGGRALYDALAAAVASNVLSVDLDYSVKNQRVMVIYLNRLIGPRFNLPLGRGGFRERRLEVACSWMTEEAIRDQDLEVFEAEQLAL